MSFYIRLNILNYIIPNTVITALLLNNSLHKENQ